VPLTIKSLYPGGGILISSEVSTSRTSVALEYATITNIEEWRAAIDHALADEGEVRIDIGELQTVDLSFLQLVEAARIDASGRGKPIHLSHPATGPLADLLQRSGRLTHADAEDHAFWFHGELSQ
tara:strand:- start:183 stop:557 length:375 start_codon:yes stop_codon:yes gene_type:complete